MRNTGHSNYNITLLSVVFQVVMYLGLINGYRDNRILLIGTEITYLLVINRGPESLK